MKQLTSCSSTHLLMNAWKSCQYYYLVLTAYCDLKKKRIFNVSTADASSSFNEAVDELFQPISGCKCMEQDVNTIAVYFYCPQLLFHTYLMQICRKTNFYLTGHLLRIIGCAKMTQKVLEIIFFCFKHSLTSY